MIRIDEEDNTTLRLTRGDSTDGYNNKIAFFVPFKNITTGDEGRLKIKPTDKISFVVHSKKGYTKDEILRVDYTLKEIGYEEETEFPELKLTEEDTRKFPRTTKPVTYWYDLVINDEKTVIGYDEEGAKKVIVYPESEEEVYYYE